MPKTPTPARNLYISVRVIAPKPPKHWPEGAMRHAALDQIAEELIVGTGAAPGASLGVAVRMGNQWRVLTGAAGRLSIRDRSPVDPQTIYDLASVSKPFLALLSAQLIENGAFAWSTPLSSLLAEASGRFAASATVEDLLSHRAGLRAHAELFRTLHSKGVVSLSDLLQEAADAKAENGLTKEGGVEPIYSDLGYMLLAAGIARLLKAPLDEILERTTTGPLGVEVRSVRLWLTRAHPPGAFAPTEQIFWRGGELTACTHDENAWAIAGHGYAGHAGLFGNVRALLTFGSLLCEAYREPEQAWSGSSEIRRLATPKPGASLAVGFDTKAALGPSSTGSAFGRNTFGHLGFTGTSLWCEPDAEVVVGLLTNRVNLGREPNRLRDARPTVHDRLLEFALALR